MTIHPFGRKSADWSTPLSNSAAAWAGTVLAPNAAFDLGSGGPVNGSVVAASLTGKGGAETHHCPFTGCLLGITVPTPTPTATATVPPVVPSGSPTAPVTPSASTSPSGSPTAPATGKPSPSGSAGPSAVPGASAGPSAQANAGGNLAHTGSGPVLPLAIGGAVVLTAGGGIVVAARRRATEKA
ncbi:choice-of-anchor A family protein [Kitasatospora sp. NPDC059648]|uniref:choice-of-anchor A family protein n=1 Tax=Kitasatospora sp. NPDC059648 TaxID=3346894 RepID=UPI003693FFB5